MLGLLAAGERMLAPELRRTAIGKRKQARGAAR
jgi:hypothetical protein